MAGASAYAQLTRMPLDPMLPITNDISLMVARVAQVYRMIAAFNNLVTLSTAGTFEQLPLVMPATTSLSGLKLAWNDKLKLIARRHNEIAGSVSGQNMQKLTMISADSLSSFRVQFYDQYRIIAGRYNALAEIIDTLNGY